LIGVEARAYHPGVGVRERSFIKAFDEFFVQKLAPEYEKQTGIKINTSKS
jgi:hypothetical protein